jgi:glycosyltransferase involved in cell wall biosynthesis
MKILIVQNRFFPAIGGVEKHTYLLSTILAQKGHEVTVFTSSSTSLDDVPNLSVIPPFVKRVTSSLPTEDKIGNVKVKRFDMKYRFWSINWIPDMFREIKNNIDTYDIIHAHGYHVTTSLACAPFTILWYLVVS